MPMGRTRRKTTISTARKIWSWFIGDMPLRVVLGDVRSCAPNGAASAAAPDDGRPARRLQVGTFSRSAPSLRRVDACRRAEPERFQALLRHLPRWTFENRMIPRPSRESSCFKRVPPSSMNERSDRISSPSEREGRRFVRRRRRESCDVVLPCRERLDGALPANLRMSLSKEAIGGEIVDRDRDHEPTGVRRGVSPERRPVLWAGVEARRANYSGPRE